MKKLPIIITILLISACGSKMMMISQADADRGAAKFPKGTVTVASLKEGKTNYEIHCQSCHELKPVTSEKEYGWRTIVPDMVKKTNRKAGRMAIDSATQESILRYVVTMCSVSPPPAK